MTEPPAEALLFDVPPPPTPVERLLHLADQYTRHNDALDLLLRTTAPSGPDAHAASALRLAADTQSAIKAIQGERLHESVELTETVMRLQQLACLATASGDLRAGTARGLTALAPEAAVSCAVTLAAETRRRRWASARSPINGCLPFSATPCPRSPAGTLWPAVLWAASSHAPASPRC
ncbi:hypothetical protein NKH18_47940 [Streptomyces sp. M10(2022)]